MASKAVRKVIRTNKRAGSTKGEALGVVKNLRGNGKMTPKAQIQRQRRQLTNEGLSATRVKRIVAVERTIAQRARNRKQGSISKRSK